MGADAAAGALSAANATWWTMAATVFAAISNVAALGGVFLFSTGSERRTRRRRLGAFAISVSQAIEYMRDAYDRIDALTGTAEQTLDSRQFRTNFALAVSIMGNTPRDIDDATLIQILNNAWGLAHAIIDECDEIATINGGQP